VKRLPWLLAKIVDPRQSVDRIDEAIKEFGDAPLEQVDEMFGLRLRGMLVDRGLLMSSLKLGVWRRVLEMWVWLVGASVCQVEFLHNRNRMRAKAAELWSHFIAKFFLDEGQRQLAFLLKTLDAYGDKKKPTKVAAGVRQPSVRDLFNKRFNEGLRVSRQTVRVNSAEYWDLNRAAWAATTDETKAALDADRASYPSAVEARKAASSAALVPLEGTGHVGALVRKPTADIVDLSLVPSLSEHGITSTSVTELSIQADGKNIKYPMSWATQIYTPE
jgi:hypothetical protein